MSRHALVITGGPVPRNLGTLPAADMVIAADVGFDNARDLGIHVDLLVGDLDSASPGAAHQAQAVERHPVDKDETDLELALAAALNAGMESVTVIGTIGGRVDHSLGNLLIVAADRWAYLRIHLRIDGTRAWVVRDRVEVHGTGDDLVSLLAVGGQATGVTTTGLAWPLSNGVLEPGAGLGLSNRLAGPTATVEVGTGVVIVLMPAATGL
ncbi:MAG: thiamine diphosphokinase [Acidimicrobiales bacterium]|nr:thiamine diphosphokinase [Acidimicrobiales bacterium]